MAKIIRDNELVWNPSKGIGPFQIGVKIEEYIHEFDLELVLEEMKDSDDWEAYRIKNRDDIRIYSVDSKVESIACYMHCNYKGNNLIGMTIKQLINVLNTEPEEEVDKYDLDDGIQFVYEFDIYGCQVWVKDNIIVTFICGDYSD